jgi:hypothetical protein
MIKTFCDRCGEIMEEENTRTYIIKSPKLNHICNKCYIQIVDFIEYRNIYKL